MLFFVGMAVAGWLLSRVVRRVSSRIPHMDETIGKMVGGAIRWGCLVIGLLGGLNFCGVNTTGVLTALSAVGIALGIALKDTLANIAAGLLLIVWRPFQLGDFIQCGDVSGTVEDIGLFATRLRTPEGICVDAPNAVFWNKSVTNYSANPTRRLDIPVGISYADSIDAGLRALLETAKSDGRVLADPAPAALVTGMDDSAVVLTLRVWLPREVYWAAKFDLTRAVKLAIEAAGLTIPFPQRDVHIR